MNLLLKPQGIWFRSSILPHTELLSLSRGRNSFLIFFERRIDCSHKLEGVVTVYYSTLKITITDYPITLSNTWIFNQVTRSSLTKTYLKGVSIILQLLVKTWAFSHRYFFRRYSKWYIYVNIMIKLSFP